MHVRDGQRGKLTKIIKWKGWEPLGSLATSIGVIVALVLAVYTYHQGNVAAEQNEVADRESLATLIGELTHETRAEASATPAQRVTIAHARLSDAEEAYALIERLREPAPAVDNYEVGLSLKTADEYSRAITSFRRAEKVVADPHFRSAAFLQEAAILFTVGDGHATTRAEADTRKAYEAYAGEPYAPPSILNYSRAYAALFDLNHQRPGRCGTAKEQLAEARSLVPKVPQLADGLKYVERRCRGSAG